jgi:hypothetical protein
LENKLRFLDFPVGAWYKTGGFSERGLFFTMILPEEDHGFTGITLKNKHFTCLFFQSVFSKRKISPAAGRNKECLEKHRGRKTFFPHRRQCPGGQGYLRQTLCVFGEHTTIRRALKT